MREIVKIAIFFQCVTFEGGIQGISTTPDVSTLFRTADSL